MCSVSHLLQAGRVQLGLINDFDRHLRDRENGQLESDPGPESESESESDLSSCQDVSSQFDFSKVSLPDGFQEAVISNVR